MLKKKLNPIVPKNKKLVISLQSWKKTNKQKLVHVLLFVHIILTLSLNFAPKKAKYATK